jgi:Protein of unknown function (DUF2877)
MDGAARVNCIPSVSLDAALLAQLQERSGRGEVHSVFDRVINVMAPWGRLVSLAAKEIDDAPWTVRVETSGWSGLGLQAGDPVFMDSRQFSIGTESGPTVLLPGAREWFAKRVDLEGLAAADFQLRADALASVLDARGVRGGILEGATERNDFEEGIAAGLRTGREGLVAAIRSGDSGGIGEAALRLIGLGPGLTPAGDDFLCGLALLASQPGSRLDAARGVLSDVVDRNAERTTELSWITLQETLKGRAREALLELLSQLFRGKAEDGAGLARRLRVPLDRVIGIGHTSGTDILCGLVAGLRLEAELRGLRA